MQGGLIYGLAAYIIWGLFPIYWKLIAHVPALQVIAHRLAWSFVVLLVLMAITGGRVRRLTALPRRVIGIYAVAACLIGVNWFTYVWAVNQGFVVETSLGYFITPLVNVLLGVVVLRERLRTMQWSAVVLAAAGVVYLSVMYGAVPRIALVLAVTFGTYGLVKKRAPLGPLDGLTVETGLLFVPAVAYLLVMERAGDGAFTHTGAPSDALMVFAGIVTTVPLLLFATAVQRVPLSVVGLLQYISPTLQFLLGVLLYGEPFSRAQLVGFSLVWIALALSAVDGLLASRRSEVVTAQVPVPTPRRA